MGPGERGFLEQIEGALKRAEADLQAWTGHRSERHHRHGVQSEPKAPPTTQAGEPLETHVCPGLSGPVCGKATLSRVSAPVPCKVTPRPPFRDAGEAKE